MTRPFTVHPLRLTPLSPIHIGSGNDLDWTQAVLDDSHMITFDPMRADLPDSALEKLSAAAGRTNPADAIISLQKLFKEQRQPLLAAATGKVGLTAAVRKKFEAGFGRNTQAHQGGESVVSELQLARHAIDAQTGLPYVPGTSLKGALRTAAVATMHGAQYPGPHTQPNPDTGDPSDSLLGRFQSSIFSRVMLSDLRPLPNAAPGLAAIVKPNRRNYKEGKAEFGVPVTVELLPAFQPGAYGGEIRIGAGRGFSDPVKHLPGLADLMRETHAFHVGLFNVFADELARENRGLLHKWLPAMRALLASPGLAPVFAEGRAALVRLGKYCSAESKTVAWRSITNSKAKPGEPSKMLHASTLWLADLGAAGRLPLGWAIVEIGEGTSEAVRDFCAGFAGTTPAHLPDNDVSGAGVAPIISDQSTPNRKRLAMLEDGYDQGKPNDPLLEATIRQSKSWSEDERLLLARLVAEKARANSKLGWKWKELDKLLLPWQQPE